MPLTIMIWNAQHFDNQHGKPSEAYQEKLSFLMKYLVLRRPDLLGLVETGKTGTVNQSLVNALKSEYTLIAQSNQEDGAKKHTTLGTLVFAKKNIADQFSQAGDYILADGEQRGAIIIKLKKGNRGFAFYHANASIKAAKNTLDAIQHIQENLEVYGLEKLCFFGGDMNVDCTLANDKITSQVHKKRKSEYERVYFTAGPAMQKLLPRGAGYTHVGIKASTLNLTIIAGGKSTTVTHIIYVATARLLDYAYVDDLRRWDAICEAALTTSGGKPVRQVQDIPMRSDHYPVLFSYTPE